MNFLLHHLLVQVLILHYVKILESSDRVPVEQHPAIRLRRRSCDVLFPIPEAKQVSAMGQDLLESRACYGPMDYIKINYSCCRHFLNMYFFSRLYPLSGKIQLPLLPFSTSSSTSASSGSRKKNNGGTRSWTTERLQAAVRVEAALPSECLVGFHLKR